MRRLEQHLTVAADPRPKPPGEWLHKPGGETREYGQTARPHGNRRLLTANGVSPDYYALHMRAVFIAACLLRGLR